MISARALLVLLVVIAVPVAAQEVTTSDEIAKALDKPVPRGLGVRMKPKIDLRVPFEINSAQLKPAAWAQLEQVHIALQQPGLERYRIQVAGHTDASGSAAYNQALSQRRADAVKAFLVEKGIDARRLVAIGLGESQLLLPDKPNHADNRRVELARLDELPAD